MMLALDASLIERFRAVLADRFGLSFDETRLASLLEVLNARLSATESAALNYVEGLERSPSPRELDALARALTIGETYFFRHSQQFDALRAILSTRFAAPNPAPPRILSAGCASGEEAYSLAILLREMLPSREPAIVAVDLNPAVLERAREGRFSAWSLRETPHLLGSRWFRQKGRDFIVDASLKSAVSFQAANLTVDDANIFRPGAYDVIFCRNVLMYFTADKCRDAVARLTRALVPGGHLFLGSAETLRGISNDYHLCHTHGAFYYCRRTPGEARTPRSEAFESEIPRRPPLLDSDRLEDQADWVGVIGRAAARVHALATPAPDARAARADPDRVALLYGETLRRSAIMNRSDLSVPLELLYKEQFSEALSLLRRLPAHVAADPEALLLEAVLLSSEGNFEQAAITCQRLLGIDELNAGAHYVLGLCGAGTGRLEEAAYHDRIATYLDPEFAMPRLHLGLMLRRSGDRTGARLELTHARSLLEREDPARLALFGGGFGRSALLELCRAELTFAGGKP